MTSLDHAMWFHAPFKADQWMLCAMLLRASLSQFACTLD
jgi:acyl-CoA thioesterase